jgi:hypothetical protein
MSVTAPGTSDTTGPLCAIIRGSFDDYLCDALPSPQRRMLRDHLASCDGCRAAAAAKDASFAFARPIAEPVSEGESREILSAVMTGVDLMRAERRIRSARRVRPRLRMGSAAAAAVAAVILISSGWGILRAPAGAAASAPQRMLSPVPPAAGAPASSAAMQPAGLSAAAAADAAPPASPDATVYDWNPGAGREEPRVVWIVDRGLDI